MSNQLTRDIPLNSLQAICHKCSLDAGWWDELRDMPREHHKFYYASRYALIHSEVSEGLEGLRKGGQDKHLPHRNAEEVELADAIIRILDYAGARGFDLSGAIAEKLKYNVTRADHTREARAAEGGKSL